MAGEFSVRVLGKREYRSPLTGVKFEGEDAGVVFDAERPPMVPGDEVHVLEKAGAREALFFDPVSVKAGVVTCGGLCPGLNDVIRAITMVLWYRYGVQDVLGLRYGYEGLVSQGHQPIVLTPEVVADIHQDGGSILGTSRGPQDAGEMVDFLVREGINVLFAIGGDGTQRGALAIADEVERRALSIAVVGVPKTIDNDISMTTRTFGFETAVSMSQAPIDAAHMEAKGVRNGVGLVKLMGRESGFVAAHASLASSNVNLVLVPEVPFRLDAVVDFLQRRLERKSHAVIVVAEGAGQDLVVSEGVDKSGNRHLGDIGTFLRAQLSERMRAVGVEIGVKYIDPSYTIRSAPTTADDSVFCFDVGRNAVHAAMAGRTAMVIGYWNGHYVHVPTHLAVKQRKKIDPCGDLWQSVLDNTGQPGLE